MGISTTTFTLIPSSYEHGDNDNYATAHSTRTGSTIGGPYIANNRWPSSVIYSISRYQCDWNTSSLTGKYILSAYFEGICAGHRAPEQEFSFCVCKSDLATMETYAQMESDNTIIGALARTSIPQTGTFQIPLSAVGLTCINTTGTTYFTMRSSQDISATAPSVVAAPYQNDLVITSAKLVVTFTDDSINILELAFNQSIFTDRSLLTWTDVSSDLMKLNVKRGRMHALDRIEAGTATFKLNNSSGNWWRYNTLGSHFGTFGDVKPLTPIRLSMTYNGTTYRKFYGMVESIKHSWLGEKGYAPIVNLECVDIFKSLARFPLGDDDPDTEDYSQELSGSRVTNVLDDLPYPGGPGWPVGMRNIDPGEVLVIPYKPKTANDRENALEHLQRVAEAEGGIIFVAGNGDIIFQDSTARQINPLDTSQATFTDVGTDSKYVEPDLVDDDTFIYNEASISGEGLEAEIVTINEDAQSTQGIRRLTRSNSLMADPLAAWEQGYVFVRRYADSILRVDSLIIKPEASPADLYPKVLGYEISTRITVVLNSTENPAALNTKYHIEGIEDDWERDGQWITKWQLWDVNQYYILKASHTDSVYAQGAAANYAVIQAQASGDATRPDTDTNYVSNWDYVPGSTEIERAVFYFDLTDIIAASVTSARLYFYVADKSVPDIDFSMSVVAGEGVSQPLVLTDYGILGDANTIYGSIANSATTIGAYNYIDLNAAGLLYLWACTGGICPLALRMNADISALPLDDNKQNIVGLTGGAIPKIIIGVEL